MYDIKIKESDLNILNDIGIYCITNLLNGKKYVGKTNYSFIKRWLRHKNDLNRNVHCNKHLQDSWNKYGINSFEFSILENFSIENKYLDNILTEKEQYWMNYYESYNYVKGYNICPSANSPLGIKRSDETKQKISNIKKEKFKNGFINPFKGKHHTIQCKELAKNRTTELWKLEEYRNKHCGKNHWAFGTHRTEKQKNNQRMIMYGKNNPSFKGTIIATNIITGEQIKLNGENDMIINGFKSSNVYKCINYPNHHKQHHGYTFERINDIEEN